MVEQEGKPNKGSWIGKIFKEIGRQISAGLETDWGSPYCAFPMPPRIPRSTPPPPDADEPQDRLTLDYARQLRRDIKKFSKTNTIE